MQNFKHRKSSLVSRLTATVLMGSAMVFFAGCQKDAPIGFDKPYELNLPAGFSMPVIPAENQLTEKRVELGKMLFFDNALSVDYSVSCASCHVHASAFGDNRKLSLGVDNREGLRNSPSLGNIAYHPKLFRDGGVPTLEQQILAPIEDKNEMAFTVPGVVERMKANPQYVELAQIAYGRQPDAFVLTRALAAYERTLITGNSRFDRYFYEGEPAALDESEKRGYQLFVSERTNCSGCHSGFDFTDYTFRNVGLYTAYADTGRKRITLLDADYGKFKVPSLRNVELTAPYMHDGSLATLEAVIEHFNSGGVESGFKDELIQPLNLTADEKRDLVNFLKSLTDHTFVENREFVP